MDTCLRGLSMVVNAERESVSLDVPILAGFDFTSALPVSLQEGLGKAKYCIKNFMHRVEFLYRRSANKRPS